MLAILVYFWTCPYLLFDFGRYGKRGQGNETDSKGSSKISNFTIQAPKAQKGNKMMVPPTTISKNFVAA
jgi:hypothetical protein